VVSRSAREATYSTSSDRHWKAYTEHITAGVHCLPHMTDGAHSFLGILKAAHCYKTITERYTNVKNLTAEIKWGMQDHNW